MVVSGVPQPRPDHLEALADLALDIADTVAGLTDSRGRAVPLRIGLASGPVVAGVVGSQRFFYDVWGDAVNVASRMESTAAVGRIQVPQSVYQRLSDRFVFEERGDVDVKGKGVMHTWYLVGRNGQREPGAAGRESAATGCLGLDSQIVQGVYAAAHPVGRIGGLRPATDLESADRVGAIAALLHLVLEEIAIPWIRVERVLGVVTVLI